jgi:WD40 repeat protein
MVGAALTMSVQHAVVAQPASAITPTPTPENIFAVETVIGKPVPSKLLYNPQYNQLLTLDAYNRLVLADANTHEPLAELSYSGTVMDILFSNDGSTLAVLTSQSVDLWDVPSRSLLQRLTALNNPFTLYGPLSFSHDDTMLLFFGEYPTPRNLRTSETDRSTFPWLWDVAAARGQRQSRLPNRAEAVQLFDYIAGAALAPAPDGPLLIGALPGRVQVMEAASLRPLYSIPIARYARDPFRLFNSQIDGRVYLSSSANNALVLVDTVNQTSIDLPLNVPLTESQLESLDFERISPLGALTLGPANTPFVNPLHQRFLGDYYRGISGEYGSRPITLSLLDIVISPGMGENRALIVLQDPETDRVSLRLSAGGHQQMTLSPDRSTLLVRETTEDTVVAYNLARGISTLRFVPALRLGRYSHLLKNRVLTYSPDGRTIQTDFQTIDAATARVLAQDVAYSRQYERFYFAPDSRHIITMSGTEWRRWDIFTGEVVQREVINLRGSVVATAASGTRLLYQDQDTGGNTVMRIAEVTDSGVRTAQITINGLAGHNIERVLPNPNWSRFLAIYSVNRFGPHAPANQVAMYTMGRGRNWLMAGDDLPGMSGRDYAWVDNDTVAILSAVERDPSPWRVYGVDYHASGLPACLVQRFGDDAVPVLGGLWAFLVWKNAPYQLDDIAVRICTAPPASLADAVATLGPSSTPTRITATPLPSADINACFDAAFGSAAPLYLARWATLTADLTPQESAQMAIRMCEGLSGVRLSPGDLGYAQPRFTMLIDAESGLRSAGDYQPAQVVSILLDPFYRRFREVYQRDMGRGILSPDRQFIVASGLPGELVVYRLTKPFETVMLSATETAQAAYNAANQIVGMPTLTATYNPIGTARPTLTPTAAQTMPPPPQTGTAVYAALTERSFCPASLTPISSLRADWGATGRLLGRIQSDIIWAIEPENGSRYPAPEAPLCREGVSCTFSPDREWILADTYDFTYVVRPDGSAERILFDRRTPQPENRRPNDLSWALGNVLNWTTRQTVQENGRNQTRTFLRRDVLNVFPDPDLLPLEGHTINQIPVSNLRVQPGGVWALADVTYNTGTGTGFRTYLYHMLTGEARLFANDVYPQWHITGDRVFWSIPIGRDITYYYQMAAEDDWTPRFLSVNLRPNGLWSNDGEQVLITLNPNTGYHASIWNPRTGTLNRYCLPETDRNSTIGEWTWSPDGQYLAVQATLPRDRGQAGVGAHTLIIRLSDGMVVDVTNGVASLISWVREPGQYPPDVRVTLTPSPTFTPSPTPTPRP